MYFKFIFLTENDATYFAFKNISPSPYQQSNFAPGKLITVKNLKYAGILWEFFSNGAFSTEICYQYLEKKCKSIMNYECGLF